MIVNKIGKQHIDYGMNCQDYGMEKNGVKLVCDGCSEGKHSEVGAKMFCHLMEYGEPKFERNPLSNCLPVKYHGRVRDMQGYKSEVKKTLDTVFRKMVEIFGQTPATIKDFLCFTILMVMETEEEFVVTYCGDGFIIEEFVDGRFLMEKLDDGEYPKYYAYNYVDKKSLKHYKDGVSFQFRVFPKSKYKNVGVASDGIRFVFAEPEIHAGFLAALRSGKEACVNRFINKNQSVFKDDTTVVL